MSNQIVNEKIRKLSENFYKNLPQKITAIQNKWQEVKNNPSSQTINELYFLAHTLFGTAGTYGATQVSQSAGRIENIILDYQNTGDEISFSTIDNEVANLIQLAHRIKRADPNIIEPVLTQEQRTKKIFILDEKPTNIQNKSHQVNYQFEYFSNVDELTLAIKNDPPDMLLLDINLTKAIPHSDLENFKNNIIIVYVADQDNIESRLFCIRHGGAGFLAKPYEMNKMIRVLDDLFGAHQIHNDRVMVVDDSKELACYYAELIRHAGMQSEVVTSAENFLHMLKDFQPDLILMDINMPYCNGIELAQVVQQYETYSIPIIFLSTITERSKQIEVLSLAGDDFLSKPIEPKTLIYTIRNRLMRSHIIRSRMTRDSLTNLYNHTRIHHLLEREISICKKENKFLCVGLLDIDHFKLVNDHYGHQAGDIVLKNLSLFLLNHLRSSDLVGRYGGEEFLIILNDTTLPDAYNILTQLIQGFAKLPHHLGGEQVYAQLSGGVAGFPSYGNAKALVKAADDALYQAKEKGRHRVEIKEPQSQ